MVRVPRTAAYLKLWLKVSFPPIIRQPCASGYPSFGVLSPSNRLSCLCVSAWPRTLLERFVHALLVPRAPGFLKCPSSPSPPRRRKTVRASALYVPPRVCPTAIPLLLSAPKSLVTTINLHKRLHGM